MSFLSTASFIVGGVFISLCIAVPLAVVIWYFKIKKIKKRMVKHFAIIAENAAKELLKNQPEEIIMDTEDVNS